MCDVEGMIEECGIRVVGGLNDTRACGALTHLPHANEMVFSKACIPNPRVMIPWAEGLCV